MSNDGAGASPVEQRVMPHEPRTNAALAKTIDSCGYLSTEVHGALTDCCRELEREIERLRTCLRIANEQAEHFEREWYLRGDALDKIAERTSSDDPCRALVQIARDALRPNVEFSGVPAGHSSNHPAGGTSAGTQG